ncbi:anti-sigma factor antagonist [Leptolyngbyaceae cyanobacterium CCMR0082]|uniref:Anti-sigma factor antagonist n=2 Tax=Adonisia turfae TaxID=2950184 RepID=A0A6M0S882_9CYAN|nr:STAS domain-containing protein [Adonisia turfae]MDV3351233.1 STAS domain-containing protein [Leptothoe sp. LEGE 181152]NEZ59068.1 anti-sigma factor antagonist [Adonisia turfae CCMR0081]NEZ64687.1 anti-sigma factor antagonist [Adonisia turfae CCMR0082]
MTTNLKTLEPAGILDGATTNELKLQVTDLLHEGIDIVLLDMNQVTFMNSTGIGAMVAMLKIVRARGKQIYLCGLTEQVKMLFELTKMDRVFKTFIDQQDFEAKILAA